MTENERRETGWFVIFSFIGGVVVGLAVATDHIREEWRTDLVQRGLALYCPDTGNWAWKGECLTTPTREKEDR